MPSFLQFQKFAQTIKQLFQTQNIPHYRMRRQESVKGTSKSKTNGTFFSQPTYLLVIPHSKESKHRSLRRRCKISVKSNRLSETTLKFKKLLVLKMGKNFENCAQTCTASSSIYVIFASKHHLFYKVILNLSFSVAQFFKIIIPTKKSIGSPLSLIRFRIIIISRFSKVLLKV